MILRAALFALFLFSNLSAIDKANRNYWNHVYSEGEISTRPSPFAEFCSPLMNKAMPVLELGCGNGRDAKYFLSQGFDFVACDLSKVSVEKLGKEHPGAFFCADFTQLGDEFDDDSLGTIYSRFTIHSVDAQGASKALAWAHRKLQTEGKLFIEVRSIKDELYGQGKLVARDAYETDHYRRFIRQEELVGELKDLGFKIDHVVQSKGLAPYKGQDPEVIRIVAKKA